MANLVTVGFGVTCGEMQQRRVRDGQSWPNCGLVVVLSFDLYSVMIISE
jgi:hypothetical protein